MKISLLSLFVFVSYFSSQPCASAAAPASNEMLPAVAASVQFQDLMASIPNLYSIKMHMRPDFRLDPEVRSLCKKIAKWPSSAVAQVDVELISGYSEGLTKEPVLTLSKYYFATVPTSDANGHLMVGLCDAK
jgi:hypothetical protein